MKQLVFLVVVVALLAGFGVVTGRHGSGLNLIMLVLLGVILQPLGRLGISVPLGPQSGTVVIFWMILLGFAAPSYGLYRARVWLGGAYVVLLSAWAALYLWWLYPAGAMQDWP